MQLCNRYYIYENLQRPYLNKYYTYPKNITQKSRTQLNQNNAAYKNNEFARRESLININVPTRRPFPTESRYRERPDEPRVPIIIHAR